MWRGRGIGLRPSFDGPRWRRDRRGADVPSPARQSVRLFSGPGGDRFGRACQGHLLRGEVGPRGIRSGHLGEKIPQLLSLRARSLDFQKLTRRRSENVRAGGDSTPSRSPTATCHERQRNGCAAVPGIVGSRHRPTVRTAAAHRQWLPATLRQINRRAEDCGYSIQGKASGNRSPAAPYHPGRVMRRAMLDA